MSGCVVGRCVSGYLVSSWAFLFVCVSFELSIFQRTFEFFWFLVLLKNSKLKVPATA